MVVIENITLTPCRNQMIMVYNAMAIEISQNSSYMIQDMFGFDTHFGSLTAYQKLQV